MQMQHLLFLLLSAVTVTVTTAAAATATSADEIRALLEFKKGISEDPLQKLFNSWNITTTASSDPSPHCGSFYGVSCDESGSVSSISLDRLDLAGEIKFNTLIPLRSLRNLSLAGNRLTGRIVPALGSMYSLQYLDLSGNEFYGPVPARINDLYGLSYLNLSRNNFTGGFPSGIRNLQQLAVLDLHSNSLWGDLGVLFSELRNVQYVDLSDNVFYGSLLSMDNGSFPSVVNTVQYVNLSRNRLGGGFFSGEALAMFRNLHVLDLSFNELNSKLPEFGALPNLQVLRLSNAQLFGPIPEELLESVVSLTELDLSRNAFSGSIPKINSTSLTTLNLSSNELSGSLPPSLGNCQIVDLSNNLLSDDISVFQKWESPVQVLDLSSNKLFGNLPNLTSSFKGLISLNLGNNSLKGSVPPILMSSPNLVFLDLRRNEFDGSIPTGLFTSMTLSHLDLSNNRFTGPIPLHGSQEKALVAISLNPPMEFLDLSYNTLMGTLPSNIGNFRSLRLLNLENDWLSGELPNELNKLSQLESLDLSNNHFKGKIPEKLSPELKFLNMSGNDLSGKVPENLKSFSSASFNPGNPSLSLPDGHRPTVNSGGLQPQIAGKGHKSKSSIKIAIIVASVLAVLMIAFVLLAYYRARNGDFRVKTTFGGQTSLTSRDIKHGISSRPTTSLSFSNTHLLTANSRSLSGQLEHGGDMVEPQAMPPAYAAASASVIPNLIDVDPTPSGRKSSPGSPMSSSPRFAQTIEQQVTLDVYSPDRFAGQLFFFDPRPQISFTAEDLSRAPAEILGRSSHGTLYKATLGGGHMLTVKWLRVGLTKDKKDFAKEIKKIGTMNHANVVRLVAYYWGPREQERLTLANYIEGDSLALHLYETTPRRYSLLSFNQRLKVAIDVARGLSYLHGRGMPHGNLKPTNIILEGPQYEARLTDFGLHRLMTPAGIAEQILNLGALGYRAPELANSQKPVPSLKADVYAFGVILMELLTRRSAGDIISGQSGAVDLTDWVRLCNQEGRGMDCIDRDIAGGEQHTKAMDDLLEVSLRCILPLTERPTVRQILEDLCAISV